MKKSKLEIASLILLGLYCAFCFINIVVCILYKNNFDNNFGTACAYLALDLTGILSFVPAMPIGVIFNIMALHKRRSRGIPRKGWLIWTIFSPLIYIVSWIISVCIFVAITGGV